MWKSDFKYKKEVYSFLDKYFVIGSILFLLFIICSFIGWLIEVSCKMVESRKFVNRGFLIDKIEGVDHKQTSSFIIQDFYIFYEKE